MMEPMACDQSVEEDPKARVRIKKRRRKALAGLPTDRSWIGAFFTESSRIVWRTMCSVLMNECFYVRGPDLTIRWEQRGSTAAGTFFNVERWFEYKTLALILKMK
jgi:hypothetical protein